MFYIITGIGASLCGGITTAGTISIARRYGFCGGNPGERMDRTTEGVANFSRDVGKLADKLDKGNDKIDQITNLIKTCQKEFNISDEELVKTISKTLAIANINKQETDDAEPKPLLSNFVQTATQLTEETQQKIAQLQNLYEKTMFAKNSQEVLTKNLKESVQNYDILQTHHLSNIEALFKVLEKHGEIFETLKNDCGIIKSEDEALIKAAGIIDIAIGRLKLENQMLKKKLINLNSKNRS